jgi:endonuclease III
MKQQQIIQILDRLDQKYPEAECALDYKNLFQLLVAVTLSAQTTDKSVNRVSGQLFDKYPNPEAFAAADVEELEVLLRPIGMYKTKSRNLISLSTQLVQRFGGQVPHGYDDLVSLPGVGRKTANVILSVGLGEQRIAVDTHVFRLANRIGLVHETDVLKTEVALMECVPKDRWTKTHHGLIFHGRNCCTARKPACSQCVLADLCEKNGLAPRETK